MGFADRSDSFDLNVTLQDHFKWLKKEDVLAKESVEPTKPNLDLAFKEGQTIRINIPKKESAGGSAKPKPSLGALGGGILPPPPGGVKHPGSANLTPMQSPSDGTAKSVIGGGGGGGAASSNVDLLGDLLSGEANKTSTVESQSANNVDDPWGDFTSAPSTNTVQSGDWVQF